jgi:hypothetical protein
MTVQRLLAAGHRPRPVASVALASETADESATAPAAFVVHTGRCGSTLLMNLLAAHPHVLAFREPEPVMPLLDGSARLDGDEQRRAVLGLDAVVRAYGAVAAAVGRRAVVKLASPCSSLAPALAARFPSTPIVGLWRDPIESVASSLAGPAGWAARIYAPSDLQARWWPILARPRTEPLTATRFFALCWASAVDGLLGVPDDRRRLLGYGELTSDANQVVEDLTTWFGLAPAPLDAQVLAEVSSTYAKDPGVTVRFDPGGEHRRPPLPPAAEADVRSLTTPAVQRLRNAGQPV